MRLLPLIRAPWRKPGEPERIRTFPLLLITCEHCHAIFLGVCGPQASTPGRSWQSRPVVIQHLGVVVRTRRLIEMEIAAYSPCSWYCYGDLRDYYLLLTRKRYSALKTNQYTSGPFCVTPHTHVVRAHSYPAQEPPPKRIITMHCACDKSIVSNQILPFPSCFKVLGLHFDPCCYC